MHQSFTVETDASPDRLFEVLSDLSNYPKWLDLVTEASPEEAEYDADTTGIAWSVTLRAKLGPFARSKQLRMIRKTSDRPNHILFERSENDGRDHSPWTMKATIKPGTTSSHSSATIELSYGGQLWSGALEAVLLSQAGDAAPRLKALVEASPAA